MDAISFELYKLSTIFTWRLYLSLIHIYTGPKGVSGLNMSAVCVRARARSTNNNMSFKRLVDRNCVMMDAQPIQKQTKTEIKSYVYCEQCAVCVWDMLKCLTSLETFERHTKLMLTKYTVHVISLMTKCSNCIEKRALQLRTHARTCVHANECIMPTGVKRRRRKIRQNYRHRHRNGALCVHRVCMRQ